MDRQTSTATAVYSRAPRPAVRWRHAPLPAVSRSRRLRVLLWVALIAGAPGVADAHVRWFTGEQQTPPNWDLLLTPCTLTVVAASAVLYLGLQRLRRLVGSPHFPAVPLLTSVEAGATTVLAVATGISLLVAAAQQDLFVPNLVLPPTALGTLLFVLQLGIAFTLITGLGDRGGALLLIVTWLLGFLVFAPWAILDQVLYVGIGLVLFVLGRSALPQGWARRLLARRDAACHAITALRVLTGCSILVVAFTEKLLTPDVALAFLQEHPQFNVPQAVFGWSWCTGERFVLMAGVAEAVIGVLLMAGVLTRVVVLAMWVPFLLTVVALPPAELLGHLPIFGILFVLLLYGSGVQPHVHDQRLAPAVAGKGGAKPGQLRGGLVYIVRGRRSTRPAARPSRP